MYEGLKSVWGPEECMRALRVYGALKIRFSQLLKCAQNVLT
jgi:hypothetical protein